MSKLFIKLSIGEWKNESRDKREISVVQESKDVEVLVVAKGEETGRNDIVDGYKVKRVSSKPLGGKVPNVVNRVISLFTWAHFVRKLSADVISGHDIVALFIAYLSNTFKKKEKKAKLIYDSHEFELERNTERNEFSTWFILHLERFLMGKSEFSIMVNDSIAEEVKKIHKQKEKAVVVRNIPTYWELDNVEIDKTRKSIIEKLGWKGTPFIVMYHGAVVKHRGADNMIKAVATTEGVIAVVLGNGDANYINDLKELSKHLNIKEKILFLNAVTIEELYKYVGSADAGIITVQPIFRSYYYMLPNKFFENIQSLTPVIVSDFPDIGGIVDEFDIGIKVNPDSIEDIAKAIGSMQNDKKIYGKYKENLIVAKEKLCWENEKKALCEAYKKVFFELEKGSNE